MSVSTAANPAHYGHHVWEDEDGETLYVLGHPPLRRALAAANHYARTEQGMTNLYDQPGVVIAGSFLRVEHEWYAPDGDDGNYHRCDESTPGATAMTVVSL